MQLSPLQSRLAASLVASLLLLTLYVLLLSPKFAVAEDTSNAPRGILEELMAVRPMEGRSMFDPTYEPEFDAFDRSILGRAASDINTLINNVPRRLSLMPGSVAYFSFERTSISQRDAVTADSPPVSKRNSGIFPPLEGSFVTTDENKIGQNQLSQGPGLVRRQQDDSLPLFISANVCVQPQPVSADVKERPQLTLYHSSSGNDPWPGPGKGDDIMSYSFKEGAIMMPLTNATGSMTYVAIAAPDASPQFDGTWNIEIAVSTDTWYHSFAEGDGELLWMDSDARSVLLMNSDLAQRKDATEVDDAMQPDPPYMIFADRKDSGNIDGVRFSLCGLQKYAQITSAKSNSKSASVTMRMSTRGPGSPLRQQIYFDGLDSSTVYSGILVRTGRHLNKRQEESPSSGGGTVFQDTPFQTTIGDNCRVLRDLEFCSGSNYAAPANENKRNASELAKFYDDYARKMYSNFEKSLMQVRCEAPATARYSLVRNCEDCKVAYKTWLCSVAIPRCEDFSSDNRFGHIRNALQQFPNGTSLPDEVQQELRLRGPSFLASRNPIIDQEVTPGPYKEILPCEDLCYDLVQSCPAALGFSCPRSDDPQFSSSYGRRESSGLSCNFPDAARNISGSSRLSASMAATLLAMVMSLALHL